jgi:hypothetical protein
MWRQVDRSAAYAARWVAKSIVAAGLAKRCIVQVAYAIGIAKPLSTYVNTYGTGTRPDSEILDIVHKNFDLRPFAIIKVSASPERNSARSRPMHLVPFHHLAWSPRSVLSLLLPWHPELNHKSRKGPPILPRCLSADAPPPTRFARRS